MLRQRRGLRRSVQERTDGSSRRCRHRDSGWGAQRGRGSGRTRRRTANEPCRDYSALATFTPSRWRTAGSGLSNVPHVREDPTAKTQCRATCIVTLNRCSSAECISGRAGGDVVQPTSSGCHRRAVPTKHFPSGKAPAKAHVSIREGVFLPAHKLSEFHAFRSHQSVIPDRVGWRPLPIIPPPSIVPTTLRLQAQLSRDIRRAGVCPCLCLWWFPSH